MKPTPYRGVIGLFEKALNSGQGAAGHGFSASQGLPTGASQAPGQLPRMQGPRRSILKQPSQPLTYHMNQPQPWVPQSPGDLSPHKSAVSHNQVQTLFSTRSSSLNSIVVLLGGNFLSCMLLECCHKAAGRSACCSYERQSSTVNTLRFLPCSLNLNAHDTLQFTQP